MELNLFISNLLRISKILKKNKIYNNPNQRLNKMLLHKLTTKYQQIKKKKWNILLINNKIMFILKPKVMTRIRINT